MIGNQPSRDPAVEHDFLSRTGNSAFAEVVEERLEFGEGRYGDRWATVGLEQLLDELSEEAADLGAWSALAYQAAAAEIADPRALDAVRRLLDTVAASGARTHALLGAMQLMIMAYGS